MGACQICSDPWLLNAVELASAMAAMVWPQGIITVPGIAWPSNWRASHWRTSGDIWGQNMSKLKVIAVFEENVKIDHGKKRGFLREKTTDPFVSVDRSSSRPVVHLGWKRGRGVETRRPPHEEATVGTLGEDEPLSWNQSQCHLENHRTSLGYFSMNFPACHVWKFDFFQPCFAPFKSLGGLRCWHLTPRSECLGPGKSREDRIWMDMGHMDMVKNHEEPMLHWWPWWTPSNFYLKWMHMDFSHDRKLDYSMYPYNGHTTICKKL